MTHPLATQAEVLAALAGGCRTFLEVGVQEGRTTELVCWSSGALDLAVLCDDWGSTSGGTGRGSGAHIERRLNQIPCRPKQVRYLNGDSRVMLPQQEDRFDLVHIDGGHSYEVASSDLKHGWRLCAHDMVVHDISFADVWRAFYEFLSSARDVAQVQCFFGGHGTAVVRRAA